MQEEIPKLSDLINTGNSDSVMREIRHVVSLMYPDFDFGFLDQAAEDTVRLFNGDYPGYLECNTPYHDLKHTMDVLLASARLLHGAFVQGAELSPRTVELALVGALFHDAGLIQSEDDLDGTGAKYTMGHEDRSVAFVKEYFLQKQRSDDDLRDCGHMILCTQLGRNIEDIPFRSPEIELGGKIMATADLLGQMADREYLEKLLLLYKEFQEAGLPYESMYDLLEKTHGFYSMARDRFVSTLGGVRAYMSPHFKHRWGLDKDLYEQAMVGNMAYLEKVLQEGDRKTYLKKLQRGGIVRKVDSPGSGR